MSVNDLSSIPQFQRAWRVVRRGAPSKALELQSNVPVPKDLKPGEVLVKVHAAALNPVGYKRMGLLPNFLMKRPHIAEHDLSGVVVDQNDTEFKINDEVCGWIEMGQQRKNQQGALAQYALVSSSHLAKKPSNVTHREAAGLTLAGMAAYGALVDLGGLLGSDKKLDDSIASSKTVFINGGSTAVGQMGIQVAKALGAKVAASCSSRNVEFVKGLGADEIYDYTKQPLYKQLIAATQNGKSKYDILFDAFGEASPLLYTQSNKYLSSKGTFVTVGATNSASDFLKFTYTVFQGLLWPVWLGGVNAKWKFITVTNDKKNLEELVREMEQGKIKPRIDSYYKFENALKAYEKIMSGKAVGKIVVDVIEPDEFN